MASKKLFLLFSILLSMVGTKAFAYYDIAVENADGVTIYYSYINNENELSVRNGDKRYSGNVNIPESVTYKNRTISVTRIGADAFKGCTGLKQVTIPNSVTSIGKNAFNGCTKLVSVTMGNSVTSIGESAFKDCSVLTFVNISDLEAWCKISFETIDSNPLRYAKHIYMNGSEITNLVIPNSVTSLGDYAFFGCDGLTSVTIGNSVTSIGGYAFYSCEGLTSVTIGNSVTNIGYRAFQYCSRLASVTMGNSVTNIEGLAFRGCYGLTSVYILDLEAWCKISFKSYESNPLFEAHHLYLNGSEITNLVIPNNVMSIGKYSFYGCSGLTSVTIPNSVTSIDSYAFYGCSGLTSVTIPNSVTSIDSYTFYGCSGLTSVTIPNSVTHIWNHAFYGCSGLTSVTIPNSVTDIWNHAFDGWYLPEVISMIENPSWIDLNSFSNETFRNATLHVPVGTINKYKTTEGWRQFVFIKEGFPSSITDIEAKEARERKRYTLDGKVVNNSHKGINIIQMNNGTTKKVIER